MILKTVTLLALRLVRRTDAPERPLIFAPPCQSELKRTLRPGGGAENTVHSRGFNGARASHLMRMVNDRFPAQSIYGFEMVDAPGGPRFAVFPSSIENLRRIEPFEFSAKLSQCKYLQFIDDC
jgi:hypothetical protein